MNTPIKLPRARRARSRQPSAAVASSKVPPVSRFAFALRRRAARHGLRGVCRRRRQAQRLGDHRHRQRDHHPVPDLRDGPGRADGAAADPRGGTRCRLVEGEMRTGAGQSEALRRRAQDVPGRAGDAGERLGAGVFHAAAARGRAGPPGTARQRRRAVEGAGCRADDRQKHGRSTRSRSVASPTATSRSSPRCPPSCRRSPRPISRSRAVQADRPQGHRPRRRAVQGQRHREVRHRRAGAGHGLCLAAARADGRRQGRERQRRRRQEDQGRHPRPVAAIRRGGRGRHGGGEPRSDASR